MTEKGAREDTHRGANGAEGHGGLQLSTSGSLDPTLSHYTHSGAADDTRVGGFVPAQGGPIGQTRRRGCSPSLERTPGKRGRARRRMVGAQDAEGG